MTSLDILKDALPALVTRLRRVRHLYRLVPGLGQGSETKTEGRTKFFFVAMRPSFIQPTGVSDQKALCADSCPAVARREGRKVTSLDILKDDVLFQLSSDPDEKVLNPDHSVGCAASKGKKAGLLIRKHDQYTPARKMRRDVRALAARNKPRRAVLSYGTSRPLGPAT